MKTVRPSLLVTSLTAALAALPYSVSAADGTWNAAANGTWSTGTDWASGAIADGTGSTAFFNTLDATTDLIVTLGGNRTIGSVMFGDTDVATAAGWTVSGDTLTLAAVTPTINVQALGAGKIATINSTLAGTSGFTKTGAGQLTVSNAGNTGLSGTVAVSQGLLVLNTTVNYVDAIAKSAPITVNPGAELRFTGGINNMVRAATDGAVLLAGGTLDYQSPTHGHMGNITLWNGAVWKATAGGGYNGENMQLNGDVTVSGTSASTIGTFTQGLGLNGNRQFNVDNATGDANVDLTVSAELEDNDSAGDGIIKTGSGTMNITTGASYTGSTQVNGGTLRLSSTLRDSSSITVNNGATLETNAVNIFVGGHGTALAASRVVTLNASNWSMTSSHDARIGNVVLNNGSTWTSSRGLGAWDVLLANVSTGAATVAVTGTGASTMNGTGGMHLQGVQNFDVANTTSSAADDLVVSMELADAGLAGGTGGVNKLGSGTMAFTRSMSYSGGTTVTAGTLRLAGGGGSTGTIRGTVTVKGGAVLDLAANDVTGYSTGADSLKTISLEENSILRISTNGGAGQNQTLGSATINMTGARLEGTSATSNLDFFGGASALTTQASAITSVVTSARIHLRQASVTMTVANGAAATDLRIDSEIYGNSLVKAGAGVLQLNGANTYTGTTTVNEGTILVNGSLAGTAVTVSSGAGFGGEGSVGGSVHFASGSTLVVANLADPLSVTGNVTFDGFGFGNLAGWDYENAALGSYTLIAGSNIAFANISNFGSANALTLPNGNKAYFDSGSLVAVIVPEPGVSLLGLAGTLMLLRRRRA